MNGYLVLLRQTQSFGCLLHRAWTLWLSLIAFAALLLGIRGYTDSWALSLQFFTLIVGAFAVAIWGIFLQSAIRQNTPAHARLVPGLRHRLMVLVAMVYAVGALGLAALGCVSTGHFGYTLAAICVFLPFFLLVQRYKWLGVVPSLVILTATSVYRGSVKQAAMQVAAYGELAFTALALAIICTVSLFSLRAAFPDGGDRHYAWRHRLGRQQGMKRNGLRDAGDSSFDTLWFPLLRVGYLKSLRRDSHAATLKSTMMMYGLGPSLHAGGFVGAVIGVLPVAWLAHYYGWDDREFTRLLVSAPPLQLMALLPALLYVQSAINAISQSVAEQGVLRLAPGMPAPLALNRVLASSLLRRYARIWSAGALVAMLVGAMKTQTFAISAYTFASITIFLPPACILLRNFAAMRQTGGDWVIPVTCLLTAVLFLGAFAASENLPGVPWLAIGVLIVAATAITLAVLWRRMITLPPAFPAGRMAS